MFDAMVCLLRVRYVCYLLLRALPAGRRVAAVLTIAILGSLPLATNAAGQPLAPPVFPGPQFGPAAASALTPRDFLFQCSVAVTTAPVRAAQITVAAGAGIQYQGCGEALALLDKPATGHFQATFAVPDGAPAGSQASAELLVLGAGGYNLHTAYVLAKSGVAKKIDVDVSGGVALTIIPLLQSTSIMYHLQLTGQARVLRQVAMLGTGMAAGATLVPTSDITTSCNAGIGQTPGAVSGVLVPLAGSYRLGGCGVVSVRLPAAAGATLAVRVGTDEALSPYSVVPTQLSLRVLDAGGHLLRKATALTSVGSGLQALWVDTRGGSVVTLTDDVGPDVVATGFSFLAAHYAPHQNPDHEEFGSPSGGTIDVSPTAMVNYSNAVLGTADATVAHQPLARSSYIVMGGTGAAQLVMTNAHGRFQARFGILDTSTTANQKHAATLTVLDQNSRPLRHVTVTAKFGAPGAVLSASIDGGSLLRVVASGGADAALYDMTMSGHATLYDRIYPPSEPPVSTPGGTPVDPRLLTIACNARIADHDTLLIHQAALEQWSLSGAGCGMATINLAALPGPHRLFSALYGMEVVNQIFALGHMHVAVLDAAGKVVRTVKSTARSGYGPQRIAVSLAGGMKLQIAWDDVPLTVFALTVA